jgi:integrase
MPILKIIKLVIVTMAIKPVGGKYEGVWVNELKNGNVAYYINYKNENGVTIKKKVGTKTKQSNFTVKDAYDCLIQTKHYLTTGQESPFQTQRSSKKFTFEDAWEAYYAWAKINKKTHISDEQYYRLHIAPIFAKKELKKLKPSDIEEFKQQYIEKGYAAQSIKHYIGLMRHIINYAIKNELIKNYANPISAGRVKLPSVDNARQAFLTKEQAKAILSELEQYDDKTMYELTVAMLYTGARFGEVVSLTWSDINFDTDMIYFKPTKNGNARWIKMNKLLKKIIKKRYKDKTSGYVFTNSLGQQINRLSKSWQIVVDNVIDGNKDADPKQRITVHSLRHTHASWLAESGLDILHIKEQLGHKTIEMTMRYAHLIPNKRHKATEEL